MIKTDHKHMLCVHSQYEITTGRIITPFEQKDLPEMFKSWISEFKCTLYDRYNFQDMYIHSAIEATLCPKIIRQGARVMQF